MRGITCSCLTRRRVARGSPRPGRSPPPRSRTGRGRGRGRASSKSRRRGRGTQGLHGHGKRNKLKNNTFFQKMGGSIFYLVSRWIFRHTYIARTGVILSIYGPCLNMCYLSMKMTNFAPYFFKKICVEKSFSSHRHWPLLPWLSLFTSDRISFSSKLRQIFLERNK